MQVVKTQSHHITQVMSDTILTSPGRETNKCLPFSPEANIVFESQEIKQQLHQRKGREGRREREREEEGEEKKERGEGERESVTTIPL